MPAGNDNSSTSSGAETSAAKAPFKPWSAIKSLPAVVTFLALTAAGLGLDLWSKHHVFNSLLSRPGLVEHVQPIAQSVPDPQKVLPYLNIHQEVCGKVKFTLSTNPGVVFGLAMPPKLVAVVSLLTIALVFFFFASGDARAWSMHVGLAFILSGAMGNLYDRLFSAVYLPGIETPITHQVRDFIDFSDLHLPFKILGYDNYPWIFNVADVLLVAGVLLLMVHWFRHRKDHLSAKD